jgi:hypothetical protein
MDDQLIDKLVDALSERLNPRELWTIKHIAQYLHRTEDSTSKQIVTLPGFPQAIRLPTPKGTKGFPMWKAAEVVNWVEKHQEKRVA